MVSINERWLVSNGRDGDEACIDILHWQIKRVYVYGLREVVEGYVAKILLRLLLKHVCPWVVLQCG